jgi:hypothetical protein
LPYLPERWLPLLCELHSSQEVTLLMLMLALARVFLDLGRNFAAGVLPSPCAMKFHLFCAGSAGPRDGPALVGASFAVAGASENREPCWAINTRRAKSPI